ncbi:hypothetical protein [Nocardia sp. NPDC058705]|uniref:hypothetical protein n=1 Tax=Nocardia sp. NPDC058705 TaxID=3346609 RepID=UPI0036B018D7
MSTQNPGPPDRPDGEPDRSPWTPPDVGAGWTPQNSGSSPYDPNAGATPPEPVFGVGGHPIGQPQPGQPRPGQPEPGAPQPGRMARQEPGVTQPRPPTVGEARARDKARRQAEEAERAAVAAAEEKKRNRKRVMIGGVAIVGVAALVGGGYLAYRAITAPDQVTASCVQIDENGQEVVVPDDKCGDGKTNFRSDSSSGGHGGGLLILGWPQYRYHYGGTPTIGKPPTGGTTVKPRNAEIKTKTGTTVQRGGLGSKSTGGSGS